MAGKFDYFKGNNKKWIGMFKPTAQGTRRQTPDSRFKVHGAGRKTKGCKDVLSCIVCRVSFVERRAALINYFLNLILIQKN